MEHASHPEIIKRLKGAHGHLASLIGMIEQGRSCLELAQQLHAVEKAISNAKRELVQDHMEHCLGDGMASTGRDTKAAMTEFKALAKYL